MTTSKAAYEQQVVSGAVGRQRSEVLRFVRERGTVSGSEVDIGLRLRGGHVRLTELFKMGLVELAGERPCKVTRKTVRTYKTSPMAR